MLNTEFMLTVGLPSITGNIVGERKAAQDFYNKYDIERMPAEKREKFYKALNNGMGLKKELAWGTGRLAAQGAGVLAGIGITDEQISRYAPEYEDNDLLRGLSTGVIGAAPVSYLASKMYTNAIARNAVDKSGIKQNIQEDKMKKASWANGYTKEELYKIAFDMDDLVEKIKGQTEVDDEEAKKKIIDAAKKAKEYVEEKAKPDPELGKIIVNGAKKIKDELFPPWYKDPKNLPIAVGGATTAGALGVAAMALNKDKRTNKKASWANSYTQEELYKIAACAKKEKDAANVFDLDDANNNITSSKFRTIEQSQNINKIIPKYQRKGGIIPAQKTVKPNLSGLARKA